MEANPLHDFLGKQFRVGDLVVYPVRQGSNMWLRCGRVIEVNRDDIQIQAISFDHRAIKFRPKNLNNITIVRRS